MEKFIKIIELFLKKLQKTTIQLMNLIKRCQRGLSWKCIERASWIFTIGAFIILMIEYKDSNETKQELSRQTSILNYILIFQMADRCFWSNNGGDRASYESLVNIRHTIKGDIGKLIDQKIKEIQKSYISSDYFVSKFGYVCKAHTKTECEEFENYDSFDYDNILEQTKDYRYWPGRTKSAYFLGNKARFKQLPKDDQEKVLQRLIDLLKAENENSLIVNKTALDSFDNLVDEFQENNIFDFQGALEYWNKRQRK